MFYAYYCATSTPRRNANNCYGPIESNSNGRSGPTRPRRDLALNKLQLFFRVRDSFQLTDR